MPDSDFRQLLSGFFEDAGVSVPTDEQRNAFNEKLKNVPEKHRPSWTERQRICRAFERGNLVGLLGDDYSQKLHPTKFIASLGTFPEDNPVLSSDQVNRGILGVCALVTGDIADCSDPGVPKLAAFKIFYKAVKNSLEMGSRASSDSRRRNHPQPSHVSNGD